MMPDEKLDSRVPELIKQYGSYSLAYHTLQSTLQHHVLPDQGYVAYRSANTIGPFGNTAFALGDPVVSEDGLPIILEDFICKHPQAAFYQIGERTARLLNDMGLYVNEFGIDTIVDLPFSKEGKKRRDVRLMYNRAEKTGVQVIEISDGNFEKHGFNQSNAYHLSDSWIGSKVSSRQELSFLARPYTVDEEFDVRKFYAVHEGMIVGFSVFDPVYSGDQIVGYAEVVARTDENAPKGTRDYVLMRAMEQFADEGIPEVSLGLSPLHEIKMIVPGTENFNRSRVAQWFFSSMYEHFDGITFNFKGLQFKKERYVKDLQDSEGRIQKVYMASTKENSLLEILTAYSITGIDPLVQMKAKPEESRIALKKMISEANEQGVFSNSRYVSWLVDFLDDSKLTDRLLKLAIK